MPELVCINRICTVISTDSPTAGICAVNGRIYTMRIAIPGQSSI